MHELVLLPATEPGDETYGSMPERIDAYPDASIHQIRFPTMVWYNKTIRRETTSKIRSLGVEHFQTVMPKTSKLVLISGESFHDEMCTFADTLAGTSINYIFLQRQHLKHHWRSGWIEEGLKALIGPGSVGN